MMNITIKTGNAAFRGPDGEEDIEYENAALASLLNELAKNIHYSTDTSGSLNDINGNKVLEWTRN